MALEDFTYEHFPNRNQLAGQTGGKCMCFFSFTVNDNSWTADGETLALDNIGMATVEYLHIPSIGVNGGNTYNAFVYEPTDSTVTATLVAPDEAADEMTEPTTTDLSSTTIYGVCFGTPLSTNG